MIFDWDVLLVQFGWHLLLLYSWNLFLIQFAWGWWRSQEDTWNQLLPMEYDANSLVCLMNKKLMTLLSFIEIMLWKMNCFYFLNTKCCGNGTSLRTAVIDCWKRIARSSLSIGWKIVNLMNILENNLNLFIYF